MKDKIKAQKTNGNKAALSVEGGWEEQWGHRILKT